MPQTPRQTLRQTARSLFDAALRAADPALALRRAMKAAPLLPPGPDGAWIVVAVGKASVAMAAEAMEHLTGAPQRVLVVTNYENHRDLPGATVRAAGHPVPDANGAAAAGEVAALLSSAGPQDRVIALISGGGSALLPAPAPGLTLEDKAAVGRILLANGFDITAMNAVRQQLSTLKGGGMLRLAAPASVAAFLLSDVIGDDLRVIASGPTVAPIASRAEARALLQSGGVWEQLPQAVRTHLGADAPSEGPLPTACNTLISSNKAALQAVEAAARNLHPQIVSDQLTGDVSAACDAILQAAKGWDGCAPACLIFGGETTVRLQGTGRGGRNQELALRVALAAPKLLAPGNWVFLSGGTDGRDGPTDAAGGIVDAGSVARMQAAGIDALALLANNDSHAALAASGDLLITGATGTNVADVQILLLAPADT